MTNKTTACPDTFDAVKHLAWFQYDEEHANLANEAMATYLDELRWDRFVMSVSIFIFVAHPIACVSTLSLLSCTPLDGESRLFRDSTQICWAGEHWSWFAAVGVAGLVFSVGIPIYTYFTIVDNAEELKAGP